MSSTEATATSITTGASSASSSTAVIGTYSDITPKKRIRTPTKPTLITTTTSASKQSPAKSKTTEKKKASTPSTSTATTTTTTTTPSAASRKRQIDEVENTVSIYILYMHNGIPCMLLYLYMTHLLVITLINTFYTLYIIHIYTYYTHTYYRSMTLQGKSLY